MKRNNKRRILVPMDLSSCTINLTEQAAKTAEESGAEVVLLHVTHLPGGLPARTSIETSRGGAREEAGAYLDGEARAHMQPYLDLLAARGLSASALVAHGDPAARILEAAREVEAEMIIMATHGRKGLARWVLGSVAEQVQRRAEVPVVTLRTQHGPACKSRGCAWCSAAQTEAQQRVLAEAEG